jgi:hypothetical protein
MNLANATNLDRKFAVKVKMLRFRVSSQAARYPVPKEKWAFAHSFLRVTPQCAEGEAKGQTCLLLKNTPFPSRFQRFPTGGKRRLFPQKRAFLL